MACITKINGTPITKACLYVLCLNSNIPMSAPIEPPNNVIPKRTATGILYFPEIPDLRLSIPNRIKVTILMIRRFISTAECQ